MAKARRNKIGYREFLKRAERGEITPSYIFTGNQIQLINEAIALLKSSLLGKHADLNYSLFYGDETTAREILETAETLPMLSPKRLCVVRRAQDLKPADMGLLENYLGSPSPTTCLVLIFNEKPKLAPKPGKETLFVDFSVGTRELAEVIHEEAAKAGVEITAPAVELLISYLGDNLEAVRSELEKLCLYAGAGEKITPSHVEKLTERTQYEDIFTLINAISNRDKRKALGSLIELEAKREEPLSVLNMISWRMRLLWRAKELFERRVSQSEAAKALRVSPGAVYYIREQEKNFSLNDIKRIMKALSEGDRLLKTSYLPREHTLTKLILDLCN